MIYNESIAKPKASYIEATITQLYYAINTVGLLELFVRTIITGNIPFRKNKYKTPDLVYSNADSLNEGDIFHIYYDIVNGKRVEYWYRVHTSNTSKKSYPIDGIPDKCPICGSQVAIIKGKVYCNNSTCPGVLFTTLKRFLILGTKKDYSLSEFTVLKRLIFSNKVKCVSDLYHLTLKELDSVWFYGTRDDSEAKAFYEKLHDTIGKISITDYLLSLPFFKEHETYNIFISSTFMSRIKSISEFLSWLEETSNELNSDNPKINFIDLESKISQEFFELLVDYFSIEDNVQEALSLEELNLFK